MATIFFAACFCAATIQEWLIFEDMVFISLDISDNLIKYVLSLSTFSVTVGDNLYMHLLCCNYYMRVAFISFRATT